MKANLQQLFRVMRDAHEIAVQTLLATEREVQQACNGDKFECADIAYALREVREYAEDIRKRSDALGRTAQATGCMLLLAEGTAQSIKSEYCTATPICKTIVSIPKKSTDPEGYKKLMQHLNVPEELYEGRQHGALSVNWPGLVELLSEQQAQGLPLPEGIDPNKTYVDYSLRILARKGILESELRFQKSRRL